MLVSLVVAMAVLAQEAAPPAAASQKLFEPTYRAAKNLQGAVGTGVAYPKYTELVQALATELTIVQDQKPTSAADVKLLALFTEVLDHYRASSEFWGRKIQTTRAAGKDQIIVAFPNLKDAESQKSNEQWLALSTRYELPITFSGGGRLKIATVPGDSPQRIWLKAEEALKRATEAYYGR